MPAGTVERAKTAANTGQTQAQLYRWIPNLARTQELTHADR